MQLSSSGQSNHHTISTTKEERNRGFNLPGRNKDVMIYLGTSFKIRLFFFFGNDWINLTQLKQPAFMSFALCDLHELRMVLNAFWKQKTAVTSQPFPIKQQNNQPILFVSSLPVCKAPFPILEVISWRTSSILRCIQCMCKLDAVVRQAAA